MLFLYTALLVVCLMLLPAVLHGQLRQLEITPDVAPATFPVFTDYPDNAAVIINSSIPNLQFSSTLDIIRDLSQSGTGRYVIIIPAARQSIQVSAAGYITQSFSVGNISAREVRHFRVEPKNVNITETGTLILRTNPSGATITIDGIPGTYTSPHTFPELLAQGYTVRIRLTDYVEEVIQVSVNPERPFIQTIDLVQTFGFLTVNTPDATLFLRDENTESEYRRSYTVRQPLRLDVGRYDFRLAREDFADATGSFEIKPNATATINPELAANFGFLSIRGSDVTVFVTPVGGGTETRLPARADQRHRLSLGAYQYRATRQDFADATGTFEITANGTTVIEPTLSATFGFLNVQGADITLFVSPAGGGSETRLPNEPNQQHRLSIGRYQYRATRDYYLESSGTFEITPNQQASITPNLQPAYGTLRVSANAPTIRLSAADNNAPTNRTSGEIYLERGRRTVVVTASGYVQQELDVRIEPGERIEQSVTLESIADRDQRVAREGLPRGVLEIATDVDAEIFVN